jgi:hypothetical protein
MRKVVDIAAAHAHVTRLPTNTPETAQHAAGETNGTHDTACATCDQPTKTGGVM